MTHRPATLRGRWVAMVLATLLAVLGQGFVTQTHFHAGAAERSRALASVAGDIAGAKSGPAAPDQPICPICREAAQAGAYLAPTPVAFAAPAPQARWQDTVPVLAPAPRQHSHAWRSRAPPQPLHA